MNRRRLRKLVRESRYEFTQHALEEMDEDGLDAVAVRTALLDGTVVATLTDDPRGIRYVIRAGPHAEEQIEVVIRALPSGIFRVITVYIL